MTDLLATRAMPPLREAGVAAFRRKTGHRPVFRPAAERTMKWMSVYLLGFVLVMAGIGLSLWKWGLWDQIDSTWRWIIVLVMLGIGLMIAVANSGRKESIEIDTK